MCWRKPLPEYEALAAYRIASSFLRLSATASCRICSRKSPHRPLRSKSVSRTKVSCQAPIVWLWLQIYTTWLILPLDAIRSMPSSSSRLAASTLSDSVALSFLGRGACNMCKWLLSLSMMYLVLMLVDTGWTGYISEWRFLDAPPSATELDVSLFFFIY